jgi:frataxin
MDSSAFETAADALLAELQAKLEVALDAADPDIELRGGILTVALDDGRQFVINKHAPTRQIWVASPVSGAAHYAWDEGRQAWRSTRAEAELRNTLAADLAQASGLAVNL